MQLRVSPCRAWAGVQNVRRETEAFPEEYKDRSNRIYEVLTSDNMKFPDVRTRLKAAAGHGIRGRELRPSFRGKDDATPRERRRKIVLKKGKFRL